MTTKYIKTMLAFYDHCATAYGVSYQLEDAIRALTIAAAGCEWK